MQGKIIKGIAGFYYVNIEKSGVYECKAKGIFRNRSVTPLVGDDVSIVITDDINMTGSIENILPRRNELIRPAVANCDQTVIVFAVNDPEPNLGLLDRMLIMMEKQHVETIICFNKLDIDIDASVNKLYDIYKNSGNRIVICSARDREGLDELKSLIKNRTTVLAGPSGVGKSTIMNILQPAAEMETGCISRKVRRGKHTTRHSELFYVCPNTYVMDTPGFSSLYVNEIDSDELKEYFNEFRGYADLCRFNSCNHLKEPGCAVKEAVDDNRINRIRYESYCQIYEELKNQKKY